jgi:hypothetical protein
VVPRDSPKTHVDTAFNHKAFKSPDARIYQANQLVLNKRLSNSPSHWSKVFYLIPWYDAAPERNVCPALLARRATFDSEIFHRSRWRDGVERHVHHGSNAPRRCGARARPETLPVRPSRFVEVYVCAVQKVKIKE